MALTSLGHWSTHPVLALPLGLGGETEARRWLDVLLAWGREKGDPKGDPSSETLTLPSLLALGRVSGCSWSPFAS